MGTRKTHNLPARLEKLQQRFERWRGTHKARSRITGRHSTTPPQPPPPSDD